MNAYVTELHVGKQQGTGTKSLTLNFSAVCDSISWRISEMVKRCISNAGWLPKQYIETENRRLATATVSTPPILPRWSSNQWFTELSRRAHQFLFSAMSLSGSQFGVQRHLSL